MRTITVSTDVYAAIWATRLPGEDEEDAILRRVFSISAPKTDTMPAGVPAKIGFKDPRFGIELPEGFEIFRTYKGVDYRAKATDGKWMLMTTGTLYPSLNQLSKAVSGNVENAWQNWYYQGDDGKRHLVTALRKT